MAGGFQVTTDQTHDVAQVRVKQGEKTLAFGDGRTLPDALDCLGWIDGEYHPDPRACDALTESAAWDATQPGAPAFAIVSMDTEALCRIVLKSEAHLPFSPWSVEAFDLAGEGRPVAAIQDAAGNFVLASVEGEAGNGAATLQALSFIRQAVPVLATRAQRFGAVIQCLVEALNNPHNNDGWNAAIKAAEAIGFKAGAAPAKRHEGAPFCPQCGRHMKPTVARVPNPANRNQVGCVQGERADLVAVQAWVCKCPPVVIG
jgi:hypothetical protein